MATLLQSQPYDITTANFKLWAGFIRTLFLTTGGWTQTSDTGQTNPTTVGSMPGTYVYEIYQATDSLAGSYPMVVKVEYGQTTGFPSVLMTPGTGTNGSGTITGGGNRQGISFGGYGSNCTMGSTGYDCVGSADAGRFGFMLWRNYPATGFGVRVPAFFAMERTKDSTGASTGNGFTFFLYCMCPDSGGGNGNNMVWRQQTILAGGAACSLEADLICATSGLTTQGQGANVASGLVFHMPGYFDSVASDILIGKAADFSEASSNTIQHYGANHTYYFSKVAGLINVGGHYCALINSNFQAVQNNGLLFRYE
jgi:hypothetical protein